MAHLLIIDVNRFNRKPKHGINFLQEQKLLGTSPSDVAEWFHVDERLDKTAIGDFLGENEDFNKEVILYLFKILLIS